MPLTPAMLARLQKRGLVAAPPQKKAVDEIYAEDRPTDATGEDGFHTDESRRAGAPGCPNKWNEFHLCGQFCYDHWQNGEPEDKLPSIYLSRRKDWQRKYPLPENWKEVYDSGVRRYYYWNFYTDEVSWFPPRHPRAQITVSGCVAAASFYEDLKLKERAAAAAAAIGKRRKEEERTKRVDSHPISSQKSKLDDDSDEDIVMTDVDKLKRARKRGIDPMDPAAYGDNVPVGKWSSGINNDMAEAADDSAGGALFERRPYPAPGAVMAKSRK